MTLTTLLALTLSVAPRALVGAYGLSSQSPFHSWLALALPVALIVGRKEIVPLADYVNPRQTLLSGINLLVPSARAGAEPFPGVLPTSRLFNLVYRGHPLPHIHSWYQTDMWTFWGIGGWRGGPWVVLVVALALGAGYRAPVERAGRLGTLWRLWWLYSCYLALISDGLDVDVAALLSLFVGGTVVGLLVRGRPVVGLRPEPAHV